MTQFSIADLDAKRRRRRLEEVKTVVEHPGLSAADRLRLAVDILQYNQEFVTFTDNKANSLLLVNSIFLATLAAGGLNGLLTLAAVAAAGLSVLLSLAVVWARGTPPGARERGQLIFFGHIRRRRSASAYADDFQNAGPAELVDHTVRQVYDLAGVVERKFAAYRWAQLCTLLSAALWIARLVVPALGR